MANVSGLSVWTLGKYALMLAGLVLVVSADRLGHHWLGLLGIGLIVVAFLLRFIYRVPRHPE